MKLTSLTATGNKSTVQANDDLFGLPVNLQLLAQAIRVQIDNGHQGTSHAQTRAEVTLTKKKIYRQKGTGGARHGAKSAPIFVGGGVTFGPVARTTKNLKLSAAQKQAALKTALSLQAPQTVVVANLEELGPKTKQVDAQLREAVPAGKKALVIVSQADAEKFRGFANLPYIELANASELNIMQVCQAPQLIMSPEAIQVLEDKLVSKTAKKSATTIGQASQKKEDTKKASVQKSKSGKTDVTKVANKAATKAKTTTKAESATKSKAKTQSKSKKTTKSKKATK